MTVAMASMPSRSNLRLLLSEGFPCQEVGHYLPNRSSTDDDKSVPSITNYVNDCQAIAAHQHAHAACRPLSLPDFNDGGGCVLPSNRTHPHPASIDRAISICREPIYLSIPEPNSRVLADPDARNIAELPGFLSALKLAIFRRSHGGGNRFL